MTKDEALKLALEALEKYARDFGSNDLTVKAMYVVRQALAQPEQEPVAWIYKGEKSFDGNKYSDEYELTASKQVALWKDKNAKPLYTTPPQRKPLSDEEIGAILEDVNAYGTRLYTFARAIEAAHGIKGEA